MTFLPYNQDRCRGMRYTISEYMRSRRFESRSNCHNKAPARRSRGEYLEAGGILRQRHEAVVKLLVEREDVVANTKDKDGQMRLWWAAEGGQEAVMKLLVERDNVVADLKNKYGQMSLSLAAAGRHEAVVKLLRSKDPRISNHT
jgi:ankyrin repeat protein